MSQVIYHEYSDVWNAVELDMPIVHCIAKDCKMGVGFAKQVRDKYPSLPDLVHQSNPTVGESVKTVHEGVTIVHLFTKFSSYGKPRFIDFVQAVKSLHYYPEKEFHMPFIGTGLDGLSKLQVDSTLQSLAQNYGIKIHVHLENAKDF